MVKRAIIWCEVVCSNCGGVIGFNYKNANTIAVLKNKTKDWVYCDDEGNLCPECQEEIKKERKSGIRI